MIWAGLAGPGLHRDLPLFTALYAPDLHICCYLQHCLRPTYRFDEHFLCRARYMYMYIYIYIHIYIYIRISISLSLYIYIYIYTCIHVCMYIYIYIYIHVCVCVCIYIYMYMYTHITIHIHAYTLIYNDRYMCAGQRRRPRDAGDPRGHLPEGAGV